MPESRGRAARVAALALAVLAGAAAADTREFRFANGLKLIVHEDHRAPVVVSQIWYRVGSSYEPPGLTGISHVLEHMMFKGTEKYGPGEFSRIIAAAGGRENAFTGRDYTAYFQQLARDQLELAFELESDRMRNLALPQAEFVKERAVVIEERRLRVEDDPQALALETARAVAFEVNPYRQPVIGWMADLEHLTIDDLDAWYRRWYAPDNAVLVVAGDVEPRNVRALAERWFAEIEPAGVAAPRPLLDPPQRGPRRAVVRAPAQVPYLAMAFKVPSLAQAGAAGGPPSWEPYALELLAAVLGAHEGARLKHALIHEAGAAAQVSVSYDLYARLPTLFTVTAVPVAGHPLEDLEARLREALEAVRRDGVSAAELERARTALVAERLYRQDSVFYQAMEIGLLEAVGLGWRVRERYEEALAAVTPERVRAVAGRYLVPRRMTVTALEPEQQDDTSAPL